MQLACHAIVLRGGVVTVVLLNSQVSQELVESVAGAHTSLVLSLHGCAATVSMKQPRVVSRTSTQRCDLPESRLERPRSACSPNDTCYSASVGTSSPRNVLARTACV